jgi:hypothetical protein
MVSYKMQALVKLMNIWNNLNQLYTEYNTKTKKIYKYIIDFYYGYNDVWMFMNNNLTPISLSNIDNYIEPDWTYLTSTTELKLTTNDEINSYKISWLSAKIRIYNINNTDNSYNDYEIDNFIENIRIKTNSNNPPTMSLLFMCWSIYTKQWFKISNRIEFHIITNMGDEEVINLNEHNNCLQIKNREINSVIPKNEETSLKLNQNLG